MKKGLFFFMCVSLVVPGVCKSGSNCWVADYGNCKVVKIGATGIRLCELDAVGLSLEPTSLDVDLQTGWCWEASTYMNRTHRISPECDSVKEHTFVNANPSTPCVDGNGYCWYVLIYTKQLVKVDESFAIIKTIPISGLGMSIFPTAAAIDLGEQALWVTENDQLEGQGSISKFLLCSGTTYQFRKSGFKASWVDVDQTTHCCWVADDKNNQVAKISSDGNTITRFDGFNEPSCVSVDPYTHCCWVADELNNRVVKLSEAGVELCVATGLTPVAVEVDPLDHGCWVSDKGNSRIVKLKDNCDTLFTVPGFLTPAGLAIDTITVGIEESELTTPKGFALLQNYPNPFTQSTVIRYSLNENRNGCRVNDLQLTIHDLSGRIVREIPIDDAGFAIKEVSWDGKDESGKKVVSGIYFYRMEAGEFKTTKKLTILR